jgi:hypothetical protein
MMTSSQSNRIKISWFWGLIIIAFIALRLWTGERTHKRQENARNTLRSVQVHEVTSFMIHPTETYTDDYREAIEFVDDDQVMGAFFDEIGDI